MHGKITRREPPDIDPRGSYRLWILAGIEHCLKQPRFVWPRLERGFDDELIRRQLSLEET